MQQDTLAIHSEYQKESQTTMNIPILMSTAYNFGTTDFAASSFNLEQGTDNVYTRVGNRITSYNVCYTKLLRYIFIQIIL